MDENHCDVSRGTKVPTTLPFGPYAILDAKTSASVIVASAVLTGGETIFTPLILSVPIYFSHNNKPLLYHNFIDISI